MSDSGITIRQAVLADLDSLAVLFDRYRQFYSGASDVAGARAFLAERFNHGESVLFIAHDGALPLGFTQLYPGFSSLSMARTFLLNDLFVDPAGRRRGIGKGLIAAARAYAVSVGAIWMNLQTARTNSNAQALYRATGWRLDEVYIDFNLPLGGRAEAL